MIGNTRKRQRLPFTKSELKKAGLPPPDTYTWGIREAQISAGYSGDDRLTVDFYVLLGAEEGRVVRQSYGLGPHQRDKVLELYEKAQALDGAGEDLTAEDLVNKAVVAELIEEIGDDGRAWPRLINFDFAE